MAFKELLANEMETQGVSRRELSRRMAARHPNGATIDTVENARRAVRRYLNGSQVPLAPTRETIAEVLGVDPSQLESDDDEEDDLKVALLRACRRRTNRSQQLNDWIDWGIRNGVFDEIPISELAR